MNGLSIYKAKWPKLKEKNPCSPLYADPSPYVNVYAGTQEHMCVTWGGQVKIRRAKC